MKLTQYFEELVNTDDTNPRIIKLIKRFVPRIEVIINKTNKLQGIDVLKVNLSKMYNYFSNFFLQGIKTELDKLSNDKKGPTLDRINKFKESLEFLKNDVDSLLENLKLDNDQISDENKKLLIQVFFSCFILYKIIKKIEKLIPNLEDFFEKSYGILFSIFEKGDVFKDVIDQKSETFFRKALGLIKSFNNNSFHKEVKKDNKEEKEKQELAEKVQSFYLKYIGNLKNFDYNYICIPPQKSVSFLIPKSTIYDLYFIESDGDEYKLNNISEINKKLTSKINEIKKRPEILENLMKIFNIVNEDEDNEKKLKKLKTSKMIIIDNAKSIKIKLDDNKKVNLKNFFPIANLVFK